MPACPRTRSPRSPRQSHDRVATADGWPAWAALRRASRALPLRDGPAHRGNARRAGADELDRAGDAGWRGGPVGRLPAAGREERAGGLGQEPGLAGARGACVVERPDEQRAAEPEAACAREAWLLTE